MKQISHLLLLSIFLASCANTVTPTPVLTETSAPTGTLALTDTPQPTPTETPDPNMPPNATGQDEEGQYIKETAEGTFTWTEKTDALTGEIVFSEWTRPITDKEGIPVVDFVYDDIKDIGSIHVYVSDKVIESANLPLFVHTNKTPEQGNDHDLTSRAIVTIFERVNGRRPTGPTMHDFLTKMLNGDISIDFFTVDPSQTYSVKFNPDFRPQVFVTDWDSLEGASEFIDMYGTKFRSKILGVDKDGNLMGVIATNVPLNSLNEEQWAEIILFHTASVVDREDQSKQFLNETLLGWLAFADNENKMSETWIEQVPNN